MSSSKNPDNGYGYPGKKEKAMKTGRATEQGILSVGSLNRNLVIRCSHS
jgi:hypothetical protein